MATQKQIVNRLKRARGQLDGLIEQLENGDANCRDVLTQFSAVNSAISRASYLTVATIMSQCTIDLAEAEAAGAGVGVGVGEASLAANASADSGDSGVSDANSNSASSSAKAGEKAPVKPKQFVKTDHITIEELEKLFLSLA